MRSSASAAIGAGPAVGRVGEMRAAARIPFESHGQARGVQFLHRLGGGRDAGLARAYLSGNTDFHFKYSAMRVLLLVLDLPR